MTSRSEIIRLPARDMTERQLMQSVTDLCRVFHLLCYHTRDSRGSSAGFPDLVIIGSAILYAELKSASGKLTIEQGVWRDGIREAGGMWALWRPEHWHSGEIRRALEAICCRAPSRPAARPAARPPRYVVGPDGIPYGPFGGQ
jgi:hypothetical protein